MALRRSPARFPLASALWVAMLAALPAHTGGVLVLLSLVRPATEGLLSNSLRLDDPFEARVTDYFLRFFEWQRPGERARFRRIVQQLEDVRPGGLLEVQRLLERIFVLAANVSSGTLSNSDRLVAQDLYLALLERLDQRANGADWLRLPLFTGRHFALGSPPDRHGPRSLAVRDYSSRGLGLDELSLFTTTNAQRVLQRLLPLREELDAAIGQVRGLQRRLRAPPPKPLPDVHPPIYPDPGNPA